MVVELHRKVSSLIEYLKQKWTYHDQRIVSSEAALQSSRISLLGVATISNLHHLVFFNDIPLLALGVGLFQHINPKIHNIK